MVGLGGVSEGSGVSVGSSVDVAVGVIGVGVGVIPKGCTAAAESNPIKITPMAIANTVITMKVRFDLFIVISPS
jgi:hypothetical protein